MSNYENLRSFTKGITKHYTETVNEAQQLLTDYDALVKENIKLNETWENNEVFHTKVQNELLRQINQLESKLHRIKQALPSEDDLRELCSFSYHAVEDAITTIRKELEGINTSWKTNCQCRERTGETWCCNHCGKPVTQEKSPEICPKCKSGDWVGMGQYRRCNKCNERWVEKQLPIPEIFPGTMETLDGLTVRKECNHPREHRIYIGRNMLRCNLCGAEFE